MRLKFDARARAILKRLPVVNVYSAAELLLLGVLAVQCARLMWVIVTPISPLGAWIPAGPAIPADPAAVIGTFDPFYRNAAAQAPGTTSVTSLQLTLYGTRMDSAQARGGAIIAGPDGVQRSVAVGEEVAPGVVLKAVAFDHVTLDRGGASEDLFLNQSGGGGGGTVSPSGSAPAANAPALAGRSIALDELRGDINAIPRIDGGRVNGLTVRGQGGEAFRAAGLRDGDVVTQIGGRPISGPGDLEQMTRQAAASGTLSLTVERDGRPLPLTIPVSR